MFNNHEEYQAYLNGQIEEIRIFQQEESKKRGCMLTDNEAALEWIEKHAKDFNQKWKQSEPNR
ncbi:MAG: hypothetical protein HZA78_07985 [Candidatus Schekmanbacteria bacterium]|nr:hypothetical protein [Candidatus Schekmanbacteria bacterium]